MIAANLTLRTEQLTLSDANRGIARLDPADLKRLGLSLGSRLAITGSRTIYATAQAATMENRNQGIVLLDDLQMHNAGVKEGVPVRVQQADTIKPITHLNLTAQHILDARAANARIGTLRRQLDGQIVSNGDILRIRMADQYDLILQVSNTDSGATGLVRSTTSIAVTIAPTAPTIATMAQLGGLRREFFWLEEWLDSVRRQPQGAMRGLILEGPPGSGKNVLIEALARYTGAHLDRINVSRVIADAASAASMFEQIFTAAASQSPSIIVVDDIDLLLPTTEDWARTILANQFYAQFDHLPPQAAVVVVGIMHQHRPIDPAALQPGRFAHRLIIEAPDHENRHEILEVLTRPYKLADDVNLAQLALQTHHFVGADLQTMVQHAHLRAQRTEKLKVRATGGKAAEQPIAMRHFRAALTETVPSQRDHQTVEASTIGWHDIAGYEDIKQILREAVERPINFGLLHDNNGAPPPHGVLVTGAPGTGKTSLVRALAGATLARFVHCNSHDIVLSDDPVGTLRTIFVKARQTAPSILFFDNIDALIPPPDSGADPRVSLTFNAFLREFDTTHDLLGLTIVAATSHADRIDQSLLRPGRFDYVINIPLPDTLTRQKIFDYHAHKMPLAADLDYDALAEATHGFSCADIAGVCRRAGLLALRQSVANQDGQLAPPVVNMAIFAQILRGWRR